MLTSLRKKIVEANHCPEGLWKSRAVSSRNEPPHNKTNKLACAPSMKKAWVLSYPMSVKRRPWSDWADAQADLSLRWAHSHAPSLIRVFTVRSIDSQGSNVSSCRQRRLWSDWADAQADLSLRWPHMPFCSVLSCCGSIILVFWLNNRRAIMQENVAHRYLNKMKLSPSLISRITDKNPNFDFYKPST